MSSEVLHPIPGIVKLCVSPRHSRGFTSINYHTGLNVLWIWTIEEELVQQHIVKRVARPDPENPPSSPTLESMHNNRYGCILGYSVEPDGVADDHL